MDVSVIVCAYSLERYHYLLDTIQSLVHQLHPAGEIIIVVDNNASLYQQISSDAIAYNWHNVTLKFNEELSGLSHARNVGIRESRGDVIAFIDDDAIAAPKWTQAMVESFASDPHVGAVTGLIVPHWENNGNWLPKELYWMISCSYVTASTTYEVERSFGTNMAFKRTVLDRTGLFDERLGLMGKKWIGGEDTELVWRVTQSGFKILYDPDVKVFHMIPEKRVEIDALLKRAFVGGTSEGHMIKVTRRRVSPKTRRHYLSTLLFEFLPIKLRDAIVHQSRVALKQALLVGMVLAFWGSGFFYGYVV